MSLTPLERKWFRATLLSDPSKEIKFRPFSVKDQKYLLLNNAEKKEGSEWNWDDWKMLLDLVQSCVDEECGVNVYEMFEANFLKLFFDIRVIGDGENFNFNWKCDNKKKGKEKKEKEETCDHNNEWSLSIKTDLECSNAKFSSKVDIPEFNRIVHLRQPSIKLLSKIQSAKYESDELMGLDMIARSITKVINGDKIEKDFSPEEATTFVDSIVGQKKLEEFSKFFEDGPKIICKKEFVCDKCGKKKVLTADEVRSFLL